MDLKRTPSCAPTPFFINMGELHSAHVHDDELFAASDGVFGAFSIAEFMESELKAYYRNACEISFVSNLVMSTSIRADISRSEFLIVQILFVGGCASYWSGILASLARCVPIGVAPCNALVFMRGTCARAVASQLASSYACDLQL